MSTEQRGQAQSLNRNGELKPTGELKVGVTRGQESMAFFAFIFTSTVVLAFA